jgi:hypothetical protein
VDEMDPELVSSIIAIVALIMVIALIGAIVHGTVSAVGAVASFARGQVKNKFWRDSGRLATLLSLVLLVLAYGFFGQEQPYSLGDALAEFGRERLLEVLPIAILTQVVLLCGFWLIYGRIFRVPRETLLEPFKSMLIAVVWIGLLSIGSVAVLLFTGDDPEAALFVLGASMTVGFLFILLALPRLAKMRAQAQGGPKPRFGPGMLIIVLFAFALLLVMPGSLFAFIYTGVSDDPTVPGMIAFVAVIVAVIMLIACYRFRAYIGQADVPPATGYFIDFSLAISALAVALVSQPGAEVYLGGLPAWLVAVAPALLVAAAVFVFNLLRLRSTTPRWALCLTVAVIAGLLVGPAKTVLAPALTPIADLFPLPGFVGAINEDAG